MDLYKILGVNKNTDIEGIKTAYRKQVLKWHPDRNIDNKVEAETMFKQISHAYTVLSNKDKKNYYDRFGSIQADDLPDPKEIFKHFFVDDDDIPNIIIGLKVKLKDLYKGCTIEKSIERYNKCHYCIGYGTEKKIEGHCVTCDGVGSELDFKHGKVIKCKKCGGSGINPEVEKCKMCTGVKFIKEKETFTIAVPPGAYDGYYIFLENEGNQIPDEDKIKYGQERSDIFFVIEELSHDKFKRGVYIKQLEKININDLLIDEVISFEESISGISLKIKHLDGKIMDISVSNFIRHTDIFVIENAGMPILTEKNDKKFGDLFIRINVNKPILTKSKRYQLWKVLSEKTYPKIEQQNVTSLDDYIEKQGSQ